MPGETTATLYAAHLGGYDVIPPAAKGDTENGPQRRTTGNTYRLWDFLNTVAAAFAVAGFTQAQIAAHLHVSRCTIQRNLWHLITVGYVQAVRTQYPNGADGPPVYFLYPEGDGREAYDAARAALRDAGGRLPVDWRGHRVSHEAGGLHHDARGKPQIRAYDDDHDAGGPASRSGTARASSLTSLENSIRDDQGDARALETATPSDMDRLMGRIEGFLSEIRDLKGTVARLERQLSFWEDRTPSTAPPTSSARAKSEPASGRESAPLVSDDLIAEMVETYRDRLDADYVRKAIAKCQKFGGRKLADDPRARLTEWLDHDLDMGAGERQTRTGRKAVVVSARKEAHGDEPDPFAEWRANGLKRALV